MKMTEDAENILKDLEDQDLNKLTDRNEPEINAANNFSDKSENQ